MLLKSNGSHLNLSKSRANFELRIDDTGGQPINISQALSSVFTWCGIEIDPRTLEVRNSLLLIYLSILIML